MPELTSKLGIKKPLGNETVTRAANNENLDIIDQMTVREPFRLKSYSYDSTADQISITIGPGRGSFLGNVVDLSTVDSVVSISAPIPNTNYYVFLKSDGTFTTNTTGNFIGNAVLLHSISTGATVDILSTKDYRGEISGDTQVLKVTVDNHISDDVIHVTQDDKDNWYSSYADAVTWVKGFGLGGTNKNIDNGKDLNTLNETGFYTVASPLNAPTTGAWSWDIIHMKNPNTDYFSQLAFRQSGDGSVFVRTETAGTWSAWQQVATQDWIKSFGLGTVASDVTYISDADALDATGFYATASSFTGSPFTGTNGSNQGYLFHQQWHGDTYAYQTHVQINGSKQVRMRIKDNGVWGPWYVSVAHDPVQGDSTGEKIERGLISVTLSNSQTGYSIINFDSTVFKDTYYNIVATVHGDSHWNCVVTQKTTTSFRVDVRNIDESLYTGDVLVEFIAIGQV